MTTVVGWQVDAVRLVVGGDDDADTVKDRVLANVLFIDAKHVRRSGGVSLEVIVELVAADIA